jgi:hypothetical protein
VKKTKNWRILLSFAVYLGLAGAIQAEPVGWSENGHYYEAIRVSGGINWEDAKLAAEARSQPGVLAHLVTLTSASENEFVVSSCGGPIVLNHYWLGGYQPPGSPEPADNWQWVTGETWDYANWYPGEPNNESGEEALAMWGNVGEWNDWDHEYGGAGYIVEYSAVPEPSTLILLTLGAGLLLQRGLRRQRGR